MSLQISSICFDLFVTFFKTHVYITCGKTFVFPTNNAVVCFPRMSLIIFYKNRYLIIFFNIRFSRYKAQIKWKAWKTCFPKHFYFYLYCVPARDRASFDARCFVSTFLCQNSQHFCLLLLASQLLLTNGDGEIRTLDPLLARQVLSQLSYTPRQLIVILCS